MSKAIRQAIAASSVVIFIATLSFIASVEKGLGPLFDGIRSLASFFLAATYNPTYIKLSAMSPEAVSAIVWDYRGLDTVFETTVFYMAIIGTVTIYRGIEGVMKFVPGVSGGLSRIVKTVTKVVLPINIAVAASIALHGHLTPGGGFQAGAAMAVIPVILIVVFSRRFLLEKGIRKEIALALRSVGLLGIALICLLPLVYVLLTGLNAYVMQNQAKVISNFSYPAFLGNILISGSIIWYNVFEFLAVTFGFTIVFLLISIDEDTVKQGLRGDVIEH